MSVGTLYHCMGEHGMRDVGPVGMLLTIPLLEYSHTMHCTHYSNLFSLFFFAFSFAMNPA